MAKVDSFASLKEKRSPEGAELKPPTAIVELKRRARAIRSHILRAAIAHYVHLGGALSCTDVMAALFFDFLRLEGEGRDRFLLSKGHAVTALHACLAELGKIDPEELLHAGDLGSRLAGHPTRKVPGVEFATGSLGHALSVAIGIAMAEQLNGSESRTMVLLGDGELQEGTVWEAALSAPRFGLKRLIAIADCNGLQAGGKVEELVPLEPLAEKWRAFRWNAIEIDGHDMAAIVAALESASRASAPTMILARTVKAKGVPSLEGVPWGHYTQLLPEDAERAIAALEAPK